MEIEFVVKTDGTVVSSVLNKADSICGNVKLITNALGREESDEHLSDDCFDAAKTREFDNT